MDHRSDRINLPADEPRCEPRMNPCARKELCARYHASLPLQDARLFDGTIGLGGFFNPTCMHFMLIPERK